MVDSQISPFLVMCILSLSFLMVSCIQSPILACLNVRITTDSYLLPNSHLCLISLPPFKDMLPHSNFHSTYGFFPSSSPNTPISFLSSLNGYHCTLTDPWLASVRTFPTGTLWWKESHSLLRTNTELYSYLSEFWGLILIHLHHAVRIIV